MGYYYDQTKDIWIRDVKIVEKIDVVSTKNEKVAPLESMEANEV